MDTTTNYGLYKPDLYKGEYHQYVNRNFEIIDGVISEILEDIQYINDKIKEMNEQGDSDSAACDGFQLSETTLNKFSEAKSKVNSISNAINADIIDAVPTPIPATFATETDIPDDAKSATVKLIAGQISFDSAPPGGNVTETIDIDMTEYDLYVYAGFMNIEAMGDWTANNELVGVEPVGVSANGTQTDVDFYVYENGVSIQGINYLVLGVKI